MQDRVAAVLRALDRLEPEDLAVLEGIWVARTNGDAEREARGAALREAREAVERAGRAAALQDALRALATKLPGDADDPDPAPASDEVFADALVAVVAWDLIPDDDARLLYLPFSEWWQERRPDTPSPFL
ncbi:MAG TPA: hypothetical protein VF235_07590 [Actinomycetota bacterium]